MKITGRGVLAAFTQEHADARRWIENWLAEAEEAAWKTPQDIKDRYASVSFLAGGRVIFNVRGNDYRLEVIVAFRTGVVVVEWAGTHAEYDQRNRRR
jgi:mRNA interferase HigB